MLRNFSARSAVYGGYDKAGDTKRKACDTKRKAYG
jgi:hypothetical protein